MVHMVFDSMRMEETCLIWDCWYWDLLGLLISIFYYENGGGDVTPKIYLPNDNHDEYIGM